MDVVALIIVIAVLIPLVVGGWAAIFIALTGRFG